VWDAATGQPLTPPLRHQYQVHHAAFSPDGRRVLTASAGPAILPASQGDEPPVLGWKGELRVWDLFPGNRAAEDWVLLAEVMAGHRLDTHGARIPLSPKVLRKGFDKLRARYPQDFIPRPADILAWHQKEFKACLGEGNDLAALFHYFHGHLDWALRTGRPPRR
jgi:hypothetical protein